MAYCMNSEFCAPKNKQGPGYCNWKALCGNFSIFDSLSASKFNLHLILLKKNKRWNEFYKAGNYANQLELCEKPERGRKWSKIQKKTNRHKVLILSTQ